MTQQFRWRREGVECPKHMLPTVITQSGLQHVCVEADCDFSVRLYGPRKEDSEMTKEDKEKRKAEIDAFVKSKKTAVDPTKTDVKPAKVPPTKIPADLNATTGKSKKELRKDNEAKKHDAPTKTEGEIKKKTDKELDEAVKPKKKEKDPDMLSVSQVAQEIGLDPKRARAKLRSLVEKDEIPDGISVTENRWSLVKRNSAEHKALVAALKPSDKPKDDEEEEDEEGDEGE